MIAIDFETANNNRLSACAIGIAFIDGKKILSKKKILIKPPSTERFSPQHTKIHSISFLDVRDERNFKQIWHDELKTLFDSHPILLHNASMDLSVLENCFNHYGISDYSIQYIDTMMIAKRFDLPLRLGDLCRNYGIQFSDNHYPEDDAEACANVYLKMVSIGIGSSDLWRRLEPTYTPKIKNQNTDPISTFNENLHTIVTYSVPNNELSTILIGKSTFVFTGDANIEREEAKLFIEQKGGFVKSSISGKTNYVVVGHDFGPSKVQKVKELNETKNAGISIITARHFDDLMGLH